MTTKETLIQAINATPDPLLPKIAAFLQQLQTAPSPTDIEPIFNQLVQQCQTETRHLSSTHQIVLHPAYQQIIGLGEAAIPLLLRELPRQSGRWFWALKAITRQDPVPPESQGKTQAMIQAWLTWGRDRGYQC